jgi:hypothetical protein
MVDNKLERIMTEVFLILYQHIPGHTEENHERPVRVVGDSADSRTAHISDTSRLNYQLNQFFDVTLRLSWYLNSLSYHTPSPVVRKQTIPMEQPPLVGEVGANFCG